ncbi:MAG: hypothetical protein V1694_10310 [Candidatus Eisenbacteria bacterium]
MDQERKNLIVGGVYLGDVTLALAGLAAELPAYVKGLDLEKLLTDGEKAGAARQEVDKMLAAESDPKTLPPELVRLALENAIGAGKFLSATRCLEILNEKDTYVEKYLGLARSHVGEGKIKEAAEALVIASSLELNEGTPLFQYAGPALHDQCTASREKCITKIPPDEAVLKGFGYLLEGPKACEVVAALAPDVRKSLLPYVALARDPDAGDFYRVCKQAHADLEEIEGGALTGLRADAKRVADEMNRFAESLGSIPLGEGAEREAQEKLLRSAASLKKEFSDIEVLLEHLQLHRVRRRLEELIESRADLERASDALKQGKGAAAAPVERVLDLIRDLAEKKIVETIGTIEERLLATQVTMLGRQVPSQEHWQYLRELAFKYPVSPLICCLRRINNKWMVVPAWDSPLTPLLK